MLESLTCNLCRAERPVGEFNEDLRTATHYSLTCIKCERWAASQGITLQKITTKINLKYPPCAKCQEKRAWLRRIRNSTIG